MATRAHKVIDVNDDSLSREEDLEPLDPVEVLIRDVGGDLVREAVAAVERADTGLNTCFHCEWKLKVRKMIMKYPTSCRRKRN